MSCCGNDTLPKIMLFPANDRPLLYYLKANLRYLVTDLGAVPMRPRGAGALYARIRAHQFPFWLDQICLGLAGGHLCSNLLA